MLEISSPPGRGQGWVRLFTHSFTKRFAAATVSISAGDLSVRIRAMRGKRIARPLVCRPLR